MGWVHGDLNPDNIVVTQNPDTASFTGSIVDLGLSEDFHKVRFAPESFSEEDHVKKCVDMYGDIEPEMFLGKTSDTFGSEVWALGSIFDAVATAFDIPWLTYLAMMCQEDYPTVDQLIVSINGEKMREVSSFVQWENILE